MKSVMQEASSLSKAIEQGWVKAGKPKEFSIRILQEPTKNFLGITLQNAKIAVFFGSLSEMPPAPREQKIKAQEKQSQAYQQKSPQTQQQPAHRQQQTSQQQSGQRPQQRNSYRRPRYRKPLQQSQNSPQVAPKEQDK